MKPGFELNNHNRNNNPLFEAHDPSMMKDPISGYYYSYCTDSAITSPYKQGIPIRRSRDLVEFEFIGMALSENAIKEGSDNGAYPATTGFWAPFVEFCEGEYRMYYSATKAFGSSESKIWLAVSKSPEGPFENRGIVVDTWFTDDTLPNGIDPHIIDDTQGRKFLVYGSFFGGIYIKPISKISGLSSNPAALGKRIALKPKDALLDGPEGAAILYHEPSEYYYLFLSYGWLGENYDIRVGRSKNVLGPYLDYHGKNLDGETYGLKIANSYCFHSDKPYAKEGDGWQFAGFRAPGHGVPFFDADKNEYFFVHHIRDGAETLKEVKKEEVNPISYRMHYMVVRRMYFIRNWPVLSPEPFANEPKEPLFCSLENKKKWSDESWEYFILEDKDNTIKQSQIGPLPDVDYNFLFLRCYDFENSQESICTTGLSSDGTAIWGKCQHIYRKK